MAAVLTRVRRDEPRERRPGTGRVTTKRGIFVRLAPALLPRRRQRGGVRRVGIPSGSARRVRARRVGARREARAHRLELVVAAGELALEAVVRLGETPQVFLRGRRRGFRVL